MTIRRHDETTRMRTKTKTITITTTVKTKAKTTQRTEDDDYEDETMFCSIACIQDTSGMLHTPAQSCSIVDEAGLGFLACVDLTEGMARLRWRRSRWRRSSMYIPRAGDILLFIHDCVAVHINHGRGPCLASRVVKPCLASRVVPLLAQGRRTAGRPG